MSAVERGRGWEMRLGDCIEIMSTLDKVDHVITDPPYEAEAHTKGRRIKRTGGVAAEPLTFPPITQAERNAVGVHAGRLSRRWSLVFCQAEGALAWQTSMHAGGSRPMRWCVWIKPDGQPQLTGDRPGVGYETTKPLSLMQELVELFTDPGETILDPFAGSGTTGVACLRLGRNFVGVEKDPRYFALACERLRAEEQGSTLQAARAGQTPLFGGAR